MPRVKTHFQRYALPATILFGLLLGYITLHKIYEKFGPVNGVLPEVTFVDRQGQPVTLASFEGQVVLVNLWATWCPPCVAELPSLNAMQAQLRDKGFKVVAISVDRTDLAAIDAFWQSRDTAQLDFYWDKERAIPQHWTYEGIPTSFLLDRRGRVLRVFNGAYKWDEEEISRTIEAALSKKD